MSSINIFESIHTVREYFANISEEEVLEMREFFGTGSRGDNEVTVADYFSIMSQQAIGDPTPLPVTDLNLYERIEEIVSTINPELDQEMVNWYTDIFRKIAEDYLLYGIAVETERRNAKLSGDQMLSILRIHPNSCSYADTQIINRYLKTREDGRL